MALLWVRNPVDGLELYTLLLFGPVTISPSLGCPDDRPFITLSCRVEDV